MAGRRTRSWSQIIPTLIILGIFLMAGIFAGVRNARQEAQKQEEAAIQASEAAHQQELAEQAAAAYNDAMAALSAKGYKCKSSANKAVALMLKSEDDGQAVYSKNYIPGAYIAETPEEVRYVVRFVHEAILFGEYLGGGNAYQHSYHVQIVDLATGDTIAEESFLGSEPPQSVTAGSGDHTGDLPDYNTIADWITSAISS